MNTNRLSRLPVAPDGNHGAIHTEPMSPMRQPTLSDIADRLRRVHNEMKKKAPVSQNRETMSAHQPNAVDIHQHLNEISRALLAEHYARRSSQQHLHSRLAGIEKALKAQAQNGFISAESFQTIVNAAAAQIQEDMKQELALQAKKLMTENQKNNQEVLRQLREATAVARFSPQLAALERQMADIQHKLEKGDGDTIGNTPIQHAEPSLKTTLAADDVKQPVSSPQNAVLRQLAESPLVAGKPAEMTLQEGEEQPKDASSTAFDAVKSAELIAQARSANRQTPTSFAQSRVKDNDIAKKLTRYTAIALMLTLSYGLYLQVGAGDTLFSFLR